MVAAVQINGGSAVVKVNPSALERTASIGSLLSAMDPETFERLRKCSVDDVNAVHHDSACRVACAVALGRVRPDRLWRQIFFSGPDWRTPSIIELWLSSSDRMRQSGIARFNLSREDFERDQLRGLPNSRSKDFVDH